MAEDEPEICRVCRSEGTLSQPLFHPCKCSGSIKYVHQDCLLEWLEHSNKRYCELCKHNFAFTPIYAADMPDSIPRSVLVARAFDKLASGIKIILRAILVATIWLILLPYFSVWIWRLYFWIGESFAFKANGLDSPAWNSTSFFASRDLALMATGNQTVGENLNTTMSVESSIMQFIARTFPEKHQWVSKFVLDCFEGQIISSVVVVVFVAMFLLQEWVIQNADLDADRRMDGMLEDAELAQAPPVHFPDEDPIEEAADLQVEHEAGRGRFNMEQAMERLIAAQHQIQAMMDGETDVEDEEATQPVLPEQASPYTAASTGSATAGPSTLQRQLSSGVAFESTTNSPDEVHRRPNQGSAFGGVESSSSLATRADTRDTLYFDATSGRFIRTPPSRTNPPNNLANHHNGEGSSSTSQQPVITEGSDVIRSKSGRLFYWDEDETIPLTVQNIFWNRDGSEMTLNQQLAKYDQLLKTGDLAFSEVRRLPMKWKTNQLFAQSSFTTTAATTQPAASDDSAASSFGSSAAAAAAATTYSTPFVRRDLAPTTEAEIAARMAAPPAHSVGRPIEPTNALDEARLEQMRQRNREMLARVQQVAENVDGAAEGFRRFNQAGQAFAPVPAPLRPPAPLQQRLVAPAPAPAMAPEPRVGGLRAAPALGDDGARGGGGGGGGGGGDVDDDFDEMGAEELHGILEVIGMHGSYWILLQNSLLMSALICATLGVGVWIPYIIGKTTLLMNSFRVFRFPMQVLSKLTDPLMDFLVDHVGPWMVQATKRVGSVAAKHIGPVLTPFVANYLGGETLQPLVNATKQYVLPMWDTLLEMASPSSMAASNATAASEVLESATTTVGTVMTNNVTLGTALMKEGINGTAATVEPSIILSPMLMAQHVMKRWTEIAYGNSSNDKFVAIMLGYVLLFLAAYWYMDQTRHVYGQTLSRVLRDIIRQQGMILKIAFFVAIEMVVFPLFCGALISLSTLPVFKGATLATRFAFYVQAPNWSIIMHWIVGTAFMFNFSMFVGACRGMVRPGVMWFIRDPNDPGFHPIREILERPIMMQLRKLGTGALMYMVLIVGGIAVTCYSIAFCLPGVFPLRLPVDRPLSDVPVDLLLFWLGPAMVRSMAISDRVKHLFEAWWNKMSQLLRLSSFMYGKRGERYPEEEGHVEYRTWRAWLLRTRPAIPDVDQTVEEVTSPGAEAVFVRDGGLYRVPNTDRILHLKDRRVLVPVNEDGSALDPMEDLPGEVDPMTDGQFHIRGIQRPPQDPKQDTVIVYGPPDFKRRLLAFVVILWASVMAFCAAMVLLPIVTGRLFTAWYLENETLHDSITFFWGACILGTLWFLVDRVTKVVQFLVHHDNGNHGNGVVVQSDVIADLIRAKTRAVGHILWDHAKVAMRLSYFTVTLAVLVPLMTTLVLELYIFLPLRRLLSEEEPGINFFLDWAFGFTFIRTVLHTLFLLQEMGLAAPPETGFMAEVNRLLVVPRVLDWDVNAVTRVLLMPYLSTAVASLSVPSILARVLAMVLSLEPANQAKLYRLIHPVSMVVFLIVFGTQQSYRVISRWSQYVRDEEYLLGRQLHNLEEEEEEAAAAAAAATVEDSPTTTDDSSATTAEAAASSTHPWRKEIAREPELDKEFEDFRTRHNRTLNDFHSASTERSKMVPRPPAETLMRRRSGAGAEASLSASNTEAFTGSSESIGLRNRDTALRRRFQTMWEDPELPQSAESESGHDYELSTTEGREQTQAQFWKRLGLSKSAQKLKDSENGSDGSSEDDEEEEDVDVDVEDITTPFSRDKGKGKKAESPLADTTTTTTTSSDFWASRTTWSSTTSKSPAEVATMTEEVEVLRPIQERGYEDDVEGDSIAARTRLRRSQRLQALGSRRSSSSSMGH